MSRLIQDTIRRGLADELLFGKLANGGHVFVDIDDKDQITLDFEDITSDKSSGNSDQITADLME